MFAAASQLLPHGQSLPRPASLRQVRSSPARTGAERPQRPAAWAPDSGGPQTALCASKLGMRSWLGLGLGVGVGVG